jgi:hypothetical protein
MEHQLNHTQLTHYDAGMAMLGGDCTRTCGIGLYGGVTCNSRATTDSGFCYTLSPHAWMYRSAST